MQESSPVDPEAERPVPDALALGISFIARHHGFGIAASSVTAGLPLTGGFLSRTHLSEAASRCGLQSGEVEPRLKRLQSEDFPLLCVLTDGAVLVLTGREGKKTISVLTMEADPQRLVLDIGDLQRRISGALIALRPDASQLETGSHDLKLTTRSWLRTAFRGTKGAFATGILATALVNIIALVMPLFTMNIYDRVIPNAALNTLQALSIGALIVILFDFLMRGLRAEIIDGTGRRVDVRLANGLFGRLLGARMVHRPASAGVQTQTLKDFESVREFFQSVTITTLGDIPFAVIFLVAIYALAGPLVLTPLVAVPVTLLICMAIQWRLKGLLAAQHHEMAVKNAVATEVVIGMETIKAIGAESWAAEKWERSIADGIRQSTRIRRYTNLAQHIVMAMQTIVTVIMVFHGVFLALEGIITTGALIAAVMLAGRALSPVGQAALLLTRISQTRIALKSLASIIESEQERDPSRHFVSKPEIEGGLVFDAVTFGYEADAPPALHAVSLAIKPGERIAILGSIGSGKSTALKAIVNLATPQAGRVFVDGIAAQHLDPAQLRRAIAYMPQDTMLFRGTIRQNIMLHCPHATDAMLLDALNHAGAMQFVSRLPKGLDTVLGERGAGLSGGQKQAIALARALVSRPKVLLLDEPTGALDGRTESALLSSVKQYCTQTGAGLVIVTHRPAVLDIVDRLIVMEDGRVQLDGPKASVMQALRVMSAKKKEAPTVADEMPVQTLEVAA
jgi:ATP-binding cassette, subfamily C, bacterial LapB